MDVYAPRGSEDKAKHGDSCYLLFTDLWNPGRLSGRREPGQWQMTAARGGRGLSWGAAGFVTPRQGWGGGWASHLGCEGMPLVAGASCSP